MEIITYRTQRTQPRFTVEVPADYAKTATELLQIAKGRKVVDLLNLKCCKTQFLSRMGAISYAHGYRAYVRG